MAIASQIYDFKNEADCMNAEKDILTQIPNPNIGELREKYMEFECLKSSEEYSTEQELPVHIIFEMQIIIRELRQQNHQC